MHAWSRLNKLGDQLLGENSLKKVYGYCMDYLLENGGLENTFRLVGTQEDTLGGNHFDRRNRCRQSSVNDVNVRYITLLFIAYHYVKRNRVVKLKFFRV